MRVKMNKKGAITDVIIWVIIAIVVAVFFGLWTYGHGVITDAFTSTGNELVNNASEAVMRPADNALNTSLDTIGIIILIGMIINIFISNFVIKGNPLFFVAYVIMAVIGIIFSATVSNAYMDLTSHEVLGEVLQSNAGMTFIMQYLPYFATVIAIVGGLFLYLGIVRETDSGVGV